MGSDWVEIGTIGRPHGVRGALHVFAHNFDTSLLTPGSILIAAASPPSGADDDQLVIEWTRKTARDWIVKWDGIDQREVAATLTNKRLFVRRQDLPDLEDGSFYQSDLIGRAAITEAGRELGVIIGFFDNGAHEVCVVKTTSGEEVLLPFREENFVEVEERGVVLDIPEGIPGLEGIDE